MASMIPKDRMKIGMLNNWVSKTIYGVIVTRANGQSTPTIGASKELLFRDSSGPAGSMVIKHEEPGGTDLVVGNNTIVDSFRITRDDTNPSAGYYATTSIEELYTYGGVFRVNKIEITLT